MPKNILQKVVFRNTPPKALYDLYMNEKKHAAVTGAPAKITDKTGSKFSAHDGCITGRFLQLVKNKLIVQSWREIGWDKSIDDSTFIIYLEPKGKDTVLYAIHTGVPDKSFDGINKGWHAHYWKPWKKYLAGKPVTRPTGM